MRFFFDYLFAIKFVNVYMLIFKQLFDRVTLVAE